MRIHVAIAAALGLAACSAETNAVAGGSGAINVATVLAATDSGAVARVVLTVTDAAAPGMPVEQAVLSPRADGVWSASILQLPAPARYTFSVHAFDAGGARLYSGSVEADLGVAGDLKLSIVVQELPPPDPIASTPVITATSISAMPIGAGESVTLSVTVRDLGQGTPTFAWRDGCGGRFGDATAPSTVWVAPVPAPAATCPLSVTVGGGGLSATLLMPVVFQ